MIPERVFGLNGAAGPPFGNARQNWEDRVASRGIIVLALWLFLSGLATADTRTYEVSSGRMQTKPMTTSTWPPYANGTTRHAERMETVDGRWALETAGPDDEKTEVWLDSKFLDSAGKVVWEVIVWDVSVLSSTVPAFATHPALAQGSGISIPRRVGYDMMGQPC